MVFAFPSRGWYNREYFLRWFHVFNIPNWQCVARKKKNKVSEVSECGSSTDRISSLILSFFSALRRLLDLFTD